MSMKGFESEDQREPKPWASDPRRARVYPADGIKGFRLVPVGLYPRVLGSF